MGQYWDIFNLDRMETMSLHGIKFGEWFFESGTTEVLHNLLRTHGSWGGDRIICLGDYSRVNDLPKGLFTTEELKDLGIQEIPKGETQLDDEIDNRLHERVKYTKSPYHLYDYSDYVLRNLSKKEYIRGGTSRDFKNGLPSLGQALFTWICWSSDPTVNGLYVPDDVPDLTRGTWAGDRLDFVLLEDIEKDLEMGGWMDVSEEVRAVVETLLDVNGL
ncbi:hypothetical protein BDQ17DRAFT_1414451 [Cyathus striatus]|nr:hypothetical protein BDQ17DRAFT_1414451 [Cyathus striatus]